MLHDPGVSRALNQNHVPLRMLLFQAQASGPVCVKETPPERISCKAWVPLQPLEHS